MIEAAPFLCAGGCGKRLIPDARRKTRYCLPCYRAHQHDVHPGRAAKISAAMKRRFTDPEYKAAHQERTAAGIRHAMANDPAFRAQKEEMGRAMGKLGRGFSTEPAGSAARMAAGAKQRATKLRHIPKAFRETYRELVTSKAMTAREATVHVRALAAAARPARLSFEEQLRRAQAGAPVVRKFKPRAADHAFTLGGVGSGML